MDLSPMLARTAPAPFDSPRHLFEVKWDGYRCLAIIGEGALRLQSRNRRDLTRFYPELSPLPELVAARQAVLDGELVVFRDGRPDFQALQEGRTEVVYVVFDLLLLDGNDLTVRPLEQRRQILQRVLPGETGTVAFSEHVMEQGKAFYRAVTARGLEGIVAKELGSPYLPGKRSRYWLKVRHVKTLEATICGYSGSRGRRIRSLVLAREEGAELIYAGRAGTGLSASDTASLLRRLEPVAISPLANHDRLPRSVFRDVVWVKPDWRCRVSFLELTADGLLRQPVYRGLVG